MYRTAYNPTASPVVVDDEGRIIGGREWGTYDTTEQAAKDALGRRDLIATDDPEGEPAADSNPTAMAAIQRTANIRERGEEVKGLDREVLEQVATEHRLVANASDARIGDLREVVTEHPEVPVPDAPTSKPARKRTSSQEA